MRRPSGVGQSQQTSIETFVGLHAGKIIEGFLRLVDHVLLDERNVDIADKLAALLKRQNNSVAAIGVLHLVGDKSVPALLGERGLSVERVY